MNRSRVLIALAGMLAALVAVALAALPASAQDSGDEEGDKQVLRIGWAQEPRTMNPFVGLDEENYTVWALNWDVLVSLSTDDLSPAPGIAESWEVSEDRRTVTFKLDPKGVWSDGEPITSADVKWSLETLGEEGDLFSSYTSNVTSIETPDDYTVVIKTKRPDARIIGNLAVYILPEHIWGKESIEDLTGSYQPELPMVGSGAFIVTEFERGRILRMEKNPEFRGEEPTYDEIQFIKYGTQDAVERALQLGEIDLIPEVESTTFERIGEDPDIDALSSSIPAYTELAFNLCSEENCPDAQFNPAIQEVDVRQAIAYSIDRERLREIATQGTSFVGNGVLPSYYRQFYEVPEEDYPFDPELANQILDDAGWVMGDDGFRTKDGMELSFDLEVRSESPFTIQMAKLIAEMSAEIGVEFNVQVISTDKLLELTTQKVDGKIAPDFDAFIWGWGGDSYDPSFMLSFFLTDEIGGSSDSFYSNPEYDRLYREQSGIFDTEERKATIQEMVALIQRDLPYLVLTEDPNLQAYRTDRIANVEPTCPSETGDLFCEAVSYAGIIPLAPAEGASSSTEGTGLNGLAGLIGLVIGFAGGVFATRGRRREQAEPLELPE